MRGIYSCVDRAIINGMNKSEKTIQTEVLSYLKNKGIYHWRNNTGTARVHGFHVRYGKIGSSDIIGITKNGKFLAIEIKDEKGIVSDEQQKFINKINNNGGLAFVARSLEDVKKEGL